MKIYSSGNFINLNSTKVMGILNLTPDSFYDGGKYLNNIKNLLKYVENMLNEGVDIIDIGGCSTRPGSKFITIKEEILRVINPIKLINKYFPEINISIDTYRSKVALAAVENGAKIINDVSAGTIDKNMFNLISKLKVPYILTHIQGHIHKKQNIKNNYKKNIIIEINNFFSKKIAKLQLLGVHDIILDPGFGFGKNIYQNIHIIKNLSLIGFKNYPIILGISRKSTLQKILNISVLNALNATSSMHILSLINGVTILRVHDIKECIECIKLVKYYNNIKK